MSKHSKKHNQSTQSPQQQSAPQESSATFEAIQKKAYEIYLEKGGSDFENWLQAEEALRQDIKGQSQNQAEYSNA